MLPRPHALLLDFGGVLVDAPTRPADPPELVHRLHALVGGAVSAEQISRDLVAGHRAYARWRDDSSLVESPTELSHEQVFHDFVAGDWPEAARAAVRRQAGSLAYDWACHPAWRIRPGIPEALRATAEAGIPMAIVSNTLCGATHRDFLARTELSDAFAVQHYSDEAGTRKPNPDMARRAARDIGVPIHQCWFVGDSLNRDIACARRAGTGAAILMRSPRTHREGPMPGMTPDATVDDGHGLHAILTTALDGVSRSVAPELDIDRGLGDGRAFHLGHD